MALSRGSLLVCAVLFAGSASAAVRIEVREGRPIVGGVFLNGHGPYRFLLDTGTTINLLDLSLARSLNMQASVYLDVGTATGSKALAGSDGNEIQIDSVSARNQRVLFSALDAIHSKWPNVQGVLGQGFLGGFDYTLDLPGRRLDFGSQETSGRRTKFTLLNGRASIPTSLGNLVLDSGARQVILFGVESTFRSDALLETISGPRAVGFRPSKLTIEGRNVWSGDAVAIAEQTEPGVAGLLPVSLFRSVYVCNSDRYVVFE